jgi:hypothetical protein
MNVNFNDICVVGLVKARKWIAKSRTTFKSIEGIGVD